MIRFHTVTTLFTAKRLAALVAVIFFTTATIAQQASAAIDLQFFDSNKILYYDPTA